MSFASPLWLAALLALPLGLAAQRLARSRARRYALRFPALESVRSAAAGAGPLAAPRRRSRRCCSPPRRWPSRSRGRACARRRRSARPRSCWCSTTPARCSRPTWRRRAWRPRSRAATTFLDQLPSTVRVGFVGFSTTPDTVLAPTTSRAAIRAALDAQVADGSTATGNALEVAIGLLQAIGRRRGRAAIVLLSDGAANAGQSPIVAARAAARDDISIDTVALGTPNGTVTLEPFEAPIPVPPDPQLMQQIALASGGRSFAAQDAGSLDSIYKGLGVTLGSRASTRDITGLFVAHRPGAGAGRGARRGAPAAAASPPDQGVAQTPARRTSVAAAAAMSCSEAHSRTEWNSWPPVKMFGVGSPRSLRREPSVPPRISVRTGSMPSARIAASAASTRAGRGRGSGACCGTARGPRSRARARGSASTTSCAIRSSRARCSASSSSSKSRRISRISAGRRRPPHRDRVDEALAARGRLGRERSAGSAATMRAASRSALTSLPVAKPGWTSTPVMRTIASSAENVSSWSSPSSEPSIV